MFTLHKHSQIVNMGHVKCLSGRGREPRLASTLGTRFQELSQPLRQARGTRLSKLSQERNKPFDYVVTRYATERLPYRLSSSPSQTVRKSASPKSTREGEYGFMPTLGKHAYQYKWTSLLAT